MQVRGGVPRGTLAAGRSGGRRRGERWSRARRRASSCVRRRCPIRCRRRDRRSQGPSGSVSRAAACRGATARRHPRQPCHRRPDRRSRRHPRLSQCRCRGPPRRERPAQSRPHPAVTPARASGAWRTCLRRAATEGEIFGQLDHCHCGPQERERRSRWPATCRRSAGAGQRVDRRTVRCHPVAADRPGARADQPAGRQPAHDPPAGPRDPESPGWPAWRGPAPGAGAAHAGAAGVHPDHHR